MHKKYAKAGFTGVSVSLDDPNDKKAREAVVKFLKEKNATFPNFILDEKPEVWQEKLKFDGPPAVFVFDREGKYKKFYENFTYEDVEKHVGELMSKK